MRSGSRPGCSQGSHVRILFAEGRSRGPGEAHIPLLTWRSLPGPAKQIGGAAAASGDRAGGVKSGLERPFDTPLRANSLPHRHVAAG